MKIQIFGNSVGLNVRPSTDLKKPYAKLLEDKFPYEKGNVIINNCKWNLMITDETLEQFANDVLQNRADYIIFNFGINECAPRTLPKYLWRILNSQDGRQNRINLFINKVIKYFSPSLIKCFNLKGWVKEEVFLDQLQKRIELIQKETEARVIVLGITEANERVEKLLPNINDIILHFNAGMANILANLERCHFVDVFDLKQETGDGIHYTAKGHQMVFERILCCIDEE